MFVTYTFPPPVSSTSGHPVFIILMHQRLNTTWTKLLEAFYWYMQARGSVVVSYAFENGRGKCPRGGMSQGENLGENVHGRKCLYPA